MFGSRHRGYKKIYKFFFDNNDDDDNDDEDDYSRFRIFGHNSPKNNFLGLKPKTSYFYAKIQLFC